MSMGQPNQCDIAKYSHTCGAQNFRHEMSNLVIFEVNLELTLAHMIRIGQNVLDTYAGKPLS
jgi:hypothetical protein